MREIIHKELRNLYWWYRELCEVHYVGMLSLAGFLLIITSLLFDPVMYLIALFILVSGLIGVRMK